MSYVNILVQVVNWEFVEITPEIRCKISGHMCIRKYVRKMVWSHSSRMKYMCGISLGVFSNMYTDWYACRNLHL